MQIFTLKGGVSGSSYPLFSKPTKNVGFSAAIFRPKKSLSSASSWSNSQKFWPAALFLLKKSEIQRQLEKMSYFVMPFSCELEKISTKTITIFACGAKGAKMSEYK